MSDFDDLTAVQDQTLPASGADAFADIPVVKTAADAFADIPAVKPASDAFADIPTVPRNFDDIQPGDQAAYRQTAAGQIVMNPQTPADALTQMHANGLLSDTEYNRRIGDASTAQAAANRGAGNLSALADPAYDSTAALGDTPIRNPNPWLPLPPREFDPNEPPVLNEGGRTFLDPTRMRQALKSQLASGALSQADYDEQIKTAYLTEQAALEHRSLLQQAGAFPQEKAALAGVGQGIVSLGAGLGTGAAVSAVAPESFGTSMLLVPAASVAAAGTAGEVYNSLLPDSLRAAQKLNPGTYTAGELATTVVPAPIGLAKAFKAAQLVQESRGALAAASFLAKPALAGAAGGAAAEGLNKLTNPDGTFSASGIAVGGALGIAFAGLPLKFKDYGPEDLADIWTRGATAVQKGLNPTDVLRPAEREVFDAMQTRFSAVMASGQTFDPEGFNATATQATAPGRGRASNTEVVGQEQGGQTPIGATVLRTEGARPAGGPAINMADPFGDIPVTNPPAALGASTPEPSAGAGTSAAPAAGAVAGSQEEFESQQATQQALTRGAPTAVLGAGGKEFPATYAWAPAGLIQPSHTGEMLAPNPNYPLTNTRDYTDPDEKDKALATRNDWDPRRAITDSPDASVGPPMVARVIDGDGQATLAVVGGNNRQWAMQNLDADGKQATLDYSNAKAGNFGLGPAPDGDSQIVRYLGSFDFRQPGQQEKLQGMVDALNPSPGMVQGTAQRAQIDAANVPLDQLSGLTMDVAPAEAQSFVRGLIANGSADRNRTAAIAASPGQAQDYVQRMLVNAAFQQPAIAEARNDTRASNMTMRGLIDAATPAMIAMRQKGAGNVADGIARTFATTLDVIKKQGLEKLPQALDAVARQTELDPVHAPALAIAGALRDAIVTNAAGRVQAEPTIEAAKALFAKIEAAVQHHQPEPDLWGEQRSVGQTAVAAASSTGAGVLNEDPAEYGRAPSTVDENGIHALAKPDPNVTLTPDEAAHDPASILASIARGGSSAGTRQRWKPGRKLASLSEVVAAYPGGGYSPDPANRSVRAAGGEHAVSYDPASGRWIKFTKPGLFGAQGEDAGAYLQRWALANRTLGDKVRFEGFTKLPGEDDYRAVISQPDRAGRDSTPAELADYLRGKGYVEQEGKWINPATGLQIWDHITPGNGITDAEGRVHPIDLQIAPANAEELKAVRERTGIGGDRLFETPGGYGAPDYAAEAKRTWAAANGKGAAIQAQVPAPAQRAALIQAYQAQVTKTGFPAVSIADVAEGAGLPLNDASKGAILGLLKTGDVAALSSGDWSLANARKQAWGIAHTGGEHPALLMRMRAELQPGAAMIREEPGQERTGYEKVPDSLMGFPKQGATKPFDEQGYPHVLAVRVTHPGGSIIHDAVRGMNRKHALERARRNWPDSKVEAGEDAPVSASGGLIERVNNAAQDEYLNANGITDPARRQGALATFAKLAEIRTNEQLQFPYAQGAAGNAGVVAGGGGGAGAAAAVAAAGNALGAAQARADLLGRLAKGQPVSKAEIAKNWAYGKTISSIIPAAIKFNLGWDVRGAVINSAADWAALQLTLRTPYFESVRVAVLDPQRRIVASALLHVGTLASSTADPTAIARWGQMYGRGYSDMLLGHNHPSGDPDPSSADRSVTTDIEKALALVKMRLVDHVITNGGRFFSFALNREEAFGTPTLAPWELTARKDLAYLHTPFSWEDLAGTLRTSDPDAIHVVYMTTKAGVTAIGRVPANATPAQIAEEIGRNGGKEGAAMVLLSLPKDLPIQGGLALASGINQLLPKSLKVYDIGTPGKPSFKLAGLMETEAGAVAAAEDDRQALREGPADYSGLQTVDDKGSPYADVKLTGLADIKIVQMPELVQLARELMGTLPELRRMPKARGQAVLLGNGKIRLDPRIFSDPVSAAKTLGHEIGHIAGWLPDKIARRGNLHGWISSLNKYLKDRYGAAAISNKELRTELIGVTKYWKPYDPATAPKSYVQYRESAAELYADAISVLFNSPATLKQMAPKFYHEFFRGLDTKPEVKLKFFELQKWLNRPMMQVLQDRAMKTDQMFAKAQDIFETKFQERQERFKGFGGWLSRFKQGFFNQFAPITDREAAAGNDHARDAARFLFDEHPMSDNRLYRWLERMQRTAIAPAEAAGFSMDDLGRQLFFHRIANENYAVSARIAASMGMDSGGRSVIANPQGHTPATARLQLLASRLENGIRGQTLLDASVQKFHDLVFDVMKEAEASGLLTPEQMAQIAGNRENYATFTPLEYIDVYLSSGIAAQAGTLKEIQNPFVSTVSKALSMMRASQFNRLKQSTVTILQRDFAGEIERAETVRGADGREIPRRPRERGIEQIMVRVAGKPQWFNVPREIAAMFERPDYPMIESALSVLNVPFRKFFHPLFIEFNPLFQLFRHPMRNVRRTLVNAPQGVGFWDIARQLPLIKAIGPNPALEAAREFVKRGKQTPLMAEMLANLAITPGDATYGMGPAKPSNSFDRLLQQAQVLPKEGHETWLEGLARKLPLIGARYMVPAMHMIQQAGRINEIVPKASIYQILTQRLGWTPREASMYVRNFVGTPNYNKKGKHISLVNSVFPFVNIWMRGWDADMELARKGYQRTDDPGRKATTPASWWFRWAMTNGVWTVLKVAGTLGLLGATMKKLYDGIGDHYKANYDVLPLGWSGQGDYGPKVAFVPVPKDPVDRIMSGVFYNVLKTAGTVAAQHGLLGADIQQMNPPDGTSVGTMLQKNMAQIDSDVPGVNPLWKIAAGWKSYLQGQNPLDDFRGQFVLSDAQYLAGGWNGVKPMLSWTYGQSGLQTFLNVDPQAGFTLEQMKNLPMINGLVKITDQGYHEQQTAAMNLDQAAAAQLKLDMPANAQRLATELGFLSKLGDKYRTDAQTDRFHDLQAWQDSVYKPAEQELRDGPENGMSSETRAQIREAVRLGSKDFERK